MHQPNGFILGVCLFAMGSTALVCAQQSCDALKQLKLEHATVVSATLQDAAPIKELLGARAGATNVTVPKHCEVKAIARPSSDSEINFTLWLPPSEAWNGKYMQRGNGGWAGSVPVASLVAPLVRGYAVSATDDGHHTEPNASNTGWAIGHPEKLIDYGFRSLHETAALSKTIVGAYYGKSESHAYFVGCSDGGREALVEAERYPEDFDGIIAGAPTYRWTHELTAYLWDEAALNETPESKITLQQLPAIQKAALAVCAARGAGSDGLIQDPRQCHFDTSVLLCHGAPSADCLTQPQINALNKIYAGAKNPKTGEQIYPGFEPGTEADPRGWAVWFVGSSQTQLANNFYSGAVYEDPRWDWHTLDFDKDMRFADEKVGSITNAANPDLRSFRDRGGKLIQYHGWGDGAVAPRDSIAFYEKVSEFLQRYPDPRSAKPADVQGFYRLFMVPGMQHCTGGPGAVSFGNDDMESLTAQPDDADHDVMLALDRWVTKDVAPDSIIASGTIGADSASKSERTPISRPLCTYPKMAHYKGQGDPNAAANFECVAPAQ